MLSALFVSHFIPFFPPTIFTHISQGFVKKKQNIYSNNIQTHLGRDKVTRTLFYCYLTSKAVRHFLSIPLQTFEIVFITIEEMNLAGRLLNAWMKIEHFEQSACTAFPYADNQTLPRCLHIDWKGIQIISSLIIELIFHSPTRKKHERDEKELKWNVLIIKEGFVKVNLACKKKVF